MAIRILLLLFIKFNSFNLACNSCVLTKRSFARCDSVTELSEIYFDDNLENVKSLTIVNAHSELWVPVSAFRPFRNLEVLDIENIRIRRLYGDTFKDLPLKKIFIQNDGVEEIFPGTFRNLSLLQTLNVKNNNLSTVSKGIFKDLPMLTSLTLSKNQISSIENSALENLSMLSKLHLDNNKLHTVFVHKIVSHPEKLVILWLHNNSLTFVSNYMLEKLTQLKLLNLGFNRISAIEANAFDQTPQLVTLVLTHNKLKEVDGSIFPISGMNYLEKLYLDNNELMFLSSSFFLRQNSLKKITLVGNPWACACLDVINRILMENGVMEKCQDLYVSGLRPICVNRYASDKVCSYKYDSELSNIYLDYRKKFPLYVNLLSCYL
nr:leucine-rich repeat-containing G-protein coupled receptor 4-like [Leptinotarsa decemlineata]